MAEHLLTEDSDFGSIPTENGQLRIRVWIGLTQEEAAVVRAKVPYPDSQLPPLFERSLRATVNNGGAIVLLYGSDHPFGDAPIVRDYREPEGQGPALLGELCAQQVTRVVAQL